MRNLLNFIWKYRNFLLFLLLETLALLFLFQTNSFHKFKFVHFANASTGRIHKTVNNFKEYLTLKQQNEQLAKENARLKKLEQNAYLRLASPVKYVEDTLYGLKYEYISAKIINKTTHRRNNYLLLDQGEEQDIAPGMGIISSKGVVGIVKDVSDHFSNAMSLLHSQTKVSAKIKRNNYFGLITWNGKNPREVQLNDIPLHVDIQIGDTIVTRGNSAIFPPGVLIGVIKDFQRNDVEGFYEINVQTGVDYGNIEYVQVVRNLYYEEEKSMLDKMNQESD